jgi:hypothetical protein
MPVKGLPVEQLLGGLLYWPRTFPGDDAQERVVAVPSSQSRRFMMTIRRRI